MTQAAADQVGNQAVNHRPAWRDLTAHATRMGKCHLRELFAEDEQRFTRFSRQACGLTLDLSKQRWNDETLDLLLALAEEAGVESAIQGLLGGEVVNCSEQRPALHTALRLPRQASLVVEGKELVPSVHKTLERMDDMVARFHSGQWRGATGKPIKDVVNLGVGGSDLGPLMTTRALSDFHPKDVRRIKVHFASTMDGSQLADYLVQLDPETTLFVLSSKSFTTIDTLSNARTALEWLVSRLKRRSAEVDEHNDARAEESLILRQHFIGVSSRPDRMSEWGIATAHQLEFWEWVGGRYSLWGAIGLPVALVVGMENFRAMLAGAHAMDRHFSETPLKDNLPVLLALAGIWNVNFLDIRAHSILPYDGRLEYFAAYLEQLEMESNGKSVTHGGERVGYSTCPVLWGQLGPNAQHAFYQLLHQGTQPVVCDFIAPRVRYDDVADPGTRRHLMAQHRLTLANCFAQSRALMLGDAALGEANGKSQWHGEQQAAGDAAEQPLPPQHKQYAGNQPSSTILLDRLTPFSLGALIALYEHKVFVQATIWDINPFDQWGVELGKVLAGETQRMLEKHQSLQGTDGSTQGLIKAVWAGEAERDA
ncbi:glucose-6-phosphate isomerase [Halomonas halocynthiae]|uniref:glucose-6-phosphate isomerase n=1 Tax=Halomonas halocynthiae TaxID=176290 RepID=UPI00047FA501|nr:glucose-6-phosphate isomerase [Halomonas halocynthiae]